MTSTLTLTLGVNRTEICKEFACEINLLSNMSLFRHYASGIVRQNCGDSSYFVEDSVGDLERIWREDIITDQDDASRSIQVLF